VLNGVDALDAAANGAAAGDLNGDGVDDFAVGAPGADPGALPFAGESYVVFGRPAARGAGFPAELELSALFAVNGGDGSAGFALQGSAQIENAARPRPAGDLNGDGVADLAVAAGGLSPDGRQLAGGAYIVYGRDAADSDADGVPDSFDNCTLSANPSQIDSNADGYGNACDGDLDDSCAVNFIDLGLMKSVFFSADADADLNGDGNVNFLDLGLMKALFFQPPGPSALTTLCAP
ncbi:MAG: hypothetical protein AAGD86_10915, partial [Pseudomonadota bacterium]